MIKGYLLLYNILQLLGWILSYAANLHALTTTFAIYSDPYASCLLKLCQTTMLLEIVHAGLGWSGAPLMPTLLQVVARCLVVYGALDLAPTTEWAASLMLVWNTVELFRYTFYICTHYNKVSYNLKWARYSLFIILYPTGVLYELLIISDAMPFIKKCCPRVLSIAMPNQWNFGFDYYWFMTYIFLPGYLIGFPYLYFYMIKQRSIKLKT